MSSRDLHPADSLRDLPRSSVIWLVVLLVASGLLRLLWLGDMSLWMDEGFTAAVARTPFQETVVSHQIEKHPIGHYLLAYLSMAIFGSSEWALRFPASISALLTVIVFFLWSMRFWSRNIAVSATAFLALSSFFTVAARDARPYAVTLFFLVLASWAWSRSLESEGATGRRSWTVWLTAGLGAVYFHYIAFVVLAWQWLVAVFEQPRERRWWLTLPLVALMYLPALPRMFVQGSHHSFTHPPPRFSTLVDLFYVQLVGFTLNFSHIVAWYGLALLSFLLVLFGSLGPQMRRLAIVYWGSTLSLIGVSSLGIVRLFEIKYFVLLTPYFWLLLVGGCFRVLTSRTAKSLIAALIAINLVSTFNVLWLEEWHRQDFRQVSSWILTDYQAGDVILIEPDWAGPAALFYLQPPKSQVKVLLIRPEVAVNFSTEGIRENPRVWHLKGALSQTGSQVSTLLSEEREVIWHRKVARRNPLQELELLLYGPKTDP